MLKLTDAERFFFTHAGYSYGNGETRRQGRVRCAKLLARAELLAREQCVAYEWNPDPDGADVQNEAGAWVHMPAVYCVLSVMLANGDYESRASLSGITESDSYRERMAYRRVVEAELAAQVFA